MFTFKLTSLSFEQSMILRSLVHCQYHTLTFHITMAQLPSNSNVTFKVPSHKQPQIQIQEGNLPFHDMSMFLSHQ